MPEGDNLSRIATVLRSVLLGQTISGAQGRRAGAQLERIVGRTVESVESRGKHLLIDFSGGLTLHTHLGLHGAWHHYRSGERWRRPPSRAALVLEADGRAVACFDAPTVELLETPAVGLHPVLSKLGPDVAQATFEPRDVLARLREATRRKQPVGEALLDQRVVAGLGNVYRSELCFLVRLNPFTPVGAVDDATLVDLLERAARLVAAASATGRRITTGVPGAGALFVYRRTGRPCRRCARPIRSTLTGRPARRVYWCPGCQP